MATAFVSELMEIRSSIDRLLEGSGASGSTKGKKGKKDKKPSSRAGKPTPHGDFTKKILEEHKEEWEAFKDEMKESNPDQKGVHLIYVKKYKDEHADEYKEFEAEWKIEHPKDAPSEIADGTESETSKSSNRKPMTDEHKAKLKAGREAAAAKKKAAKEAEAETAKIPVAPEFSATTVVVTPSAPAKKAVKTVAKKVVAPVVVVATPEDDDPEFIPFKHLGTNYLRLGSKREDGNHLWASGDLWESKKGAKGKYMGCLQDDGKIDSTAEEPNLE